MDGLQQSFQLGLGVFVIGGCGSAERHKSLPELAGFGCHGQGRKVWILQRVGQNHQTLVDSESLMSTNTLRQKTSHGAAGKQSRTLTPLAPNQGLEQGEMPGSHSSNLVGVRKRVDMIIFGGSSSHV